jgi:hypothetical protein
VSSLSLVVLIVIEIISVSRLTLFQLSCSWTVEALRPEVSESSLRLSPLVDVESPRRAYYLPFWAERQAQADAECSTSESCEEESPPRPLAEMYFDVSTQVDHVSTCADSCSNG